MLKLAEQHVLSLEPYVPGRPIENDKRIETWAKLASNENCLGPSKNALEAIASSMKSVHLYPNAKRLLVIERICEHLKENNVRPECVALGNGTSELIVNLVRGVLGTSEAILYGWPSFVMYRLAAMAQGRQCYAVPLNSDMSYDVDKVIHQASQKTNAPVKLVIVANPNNPTGNYLSKIELEYLVNKLPDDIVLVIDEAYFEYVTRDDYPNGLDYALSRPRTIVLRTFSKVYGLAGLRLGYAVGDADVISVLCRIRDPFNVNSVAQSAAIAALDDVEHLTRSIKHNLQMRPYLAAGLRNFGFVVNEGVGNFVLAKKSLTMPKIADLANALMSFGVIIRPLEAFGLKDHVRVTVGTKQEIDQLFKSLELVSDAFRQ